MRLIFNNIELENQFRSNGYVVCKLEDFDSEYLLRSFEKSNTGISSGFYASLYSNNDDFKKKSDEIVRNVLGEKVKNFLNKYSITAGNYMVKPANDTTGKLSIHQDWNLIFETNELRSINVWIPLTEIAPNMGRLHIMKGSHKVMKDVLRASPFYPTPLSKIDIKSLEFLAEEIQVPYGYACFMDHGLIHYSPPNFSNTTRVCVSLNLKPEESKLIHYYFDSENEKLECYLVDTEFFLHHKIGDRPIGYPLISVVLHQPKFENLNSLLNKLKKQANISSEKQVFFLFKEKMKRIF